MIIQYVQSREGDTLFFLNTKIQAKFVPFKENL